MLRRDGATTGRKTGHALANYFAGAEEARGKSGEAKICIIMRQSQDGQRRDEREKRKVLVVMGETMVDSVACREG